MNINSESINNMEKSDRYCFVCGQDNTKGLQLQFKYSPNKAYTEVTFLEEHQGWEGMVHGGLIGAILDEVMAHAVYKHKGKAVTASINIRYRQAISIGEPVEVIGEIVSHKKNLAQTKASVRFHYGGIAAEASGKFFMLD